jgi:hypothetical protein
MTALVIALLGLWLLLSIANQLDGPIRRALAGLNALHLLPRYTFFAPDPIDVDYHLVFRDLAADGSPTAWQECFLGPERRHGLVEVFWDPSHRAHTTLNQVVVAITLLGSSVARASDLGVRVVAVSFPYTFLLHAAMRSPASEQSMRRQFMIVETVGTRPNRRMRLGILSEKHRIARSSA